MKKTVCALLTACLLLSSGCSLSDAEFTVDDARRDARECLEEHRGEMEAIAASGQASGETKWCLSYSLLGDGGYEFDLYREGFTGTNTVAGVLYLPDDTPDSDYVQDPADPNLYILERGATDRYRLERMAQNWFFFYYEYDF